MIYLMLAALVLLLFSYDKVNQPMPYEPYQKRGAKLIRERQLVNAELAGFAIALMIIVAGIRTTRVGLDLGLFYAPAWQNMVEDKSHTFSWGREFIFNGLNQIAYRIFGASGLPVVLILLALVMVGCVYFVAKKVSPNVAVTMFLMITVTFYLRGFSEVRQCTATACCVVAGYAALNLSRQNWWKNLILWAVMMFVAVGFHLPSLICLPVILLRLLRNDYLQIAFMIEMLFAGIIFIIFEEAIIKFACQIIHQNYYYDYYVRSGYAENSLIPLGRVQIALAIITWLGCYIYKWVYQVRTHRKIGAAYDFFLNLWFVATVLFLVAALADRFMLYNRLATYFTWSIVFLVPLLLSTIQNRRAKMLTTIAALAAGAIYLGIFLHFNEYMVLPYEIVA